MPVGLTAHASVSLSATRIIYLHGSKQASISVTNATEDRAYLVQSWVADSQGTKSPDFVVTPPLFLLNAGKESSLRLIYAGSQPLPEDRESLYYFISKAIPSVPKQLQGTNQLQVATQNKIKLFYRPDDLAGKPEEAPATLHCQLGNSGLTVTNPSPYYVTLTNIQIGGKNVGNLMVSPKDSQRLATSVASGDVTFQTINDYGAVTDAQRCKPH